MHADMEIHSAAKLNMPHLRRDCGTGARSALNSRLCVKSTSTSGAFAVRPELFMGFLKSSKLQAPTSREAPTFNVQTKLHVAWFEAWCLKFLWSLDVGAWSFHIKRRCPRSTTPAWPR